MANASRWTPLHARVHQAIRQRHLFEKDQALLVAVSGGQDSLCLMRLLLDLQSCWGWTLAIAHCDHRWRSNSGANACQVESLAIQWRVPFHLAIAPEAVAQDRREATARDWRYQALTEMAQTQEFHCVVTGHTASDRAETLIYNLMRGSGLDGLQALTWRRSLTHDADPITLVRPLLTTTRAETGRFCQESGLSVWEDSTNSDVQYSRNRIRLQLLPFIQQSFNPKIEETLAQTAELIQADVECLERLTDKLWQCSVVYEPVVSLSRQGSLEPESLVTKPKINRQELRSVPLALQRRVMRRCLLRLLPEAPGFDHIEKLTALIDAPNRSQTDPFPGGAIARVDGIWICFDELP